MVLQGKFLKKEGLMFQIKYHKIYKILFFVCVGLFFPSFSFSWPENLKRSFQLEIFRNPGLDIDDFRYMAAAILVAEQNLSRDIAVSLTKNMSRKDVQKILTQDFRMTYYEIPLSVLKIDSQFQAEGRNSIATLQIFQINGTKKVRWFVHPLHSTEEFEKKYQAYLGPPGRFRGLLTSSRSMIIKDIVTQDYWSVKTSLAVAQGQFKDKRYNSVQAQYHFEMSQIIDSDPYLKNRFFIEDSYVALKDESFDEGQIVRSLDPYKTGYQIQALATLLDPRISVPLARKNGFGDDWQKFVTDLIMPDLGATMGHLYERYGLVHNSLHSQNVTVEFDLNSKFVGTKVRDPDFDVDIDRYKEVLGKAAADAFLATSNIRNHQTLIIDLSVLNGLRSFQLTGAAKRRFYRALGLSFYSGFIKRLTELRQISLPRNELTQRLQNLVKVDTIDPFGIRWSVSLFPDQIDSILDPQSDISLLDSQNLKVVTLDLENTEELIIKKIEGLDPGLTANDESLVELGWKALVKEYQIDGVNSRLAKILEEKNPNKIRRLISFLNQFKNFEKSSFIRLALERHPHSFRDNDTAFFFNAHQSDEMLKLYLVRTSAGNLARLWEWRKANKLLEYPQPLINRYFALLTDSQLKIIQEHLRFSEQAASNEYSDLKGFKFKIEEAFRVRGKLPSIISQDCRSALRN